MSSRQLLVARAIARETSTQCIPGPATSSEGRTKRGSSSSRRAILNSGRAYESVPGEHHVHRQPPAALGDEPLLGRGHHLGGAAARLVGLEEDLEAALVDADGVAHRLELGLALHGAREVELDVEGNELEPVERGAVAHGHDVVEAVDADAPPPRSPRPVRDVLAGAVVEHLLDLGRAVLADVARLAREDDRGSPSAGTTTYA